MNKRQALLIIDVQNDFCPGGALAVPKGNRIIPALNRSIDYFAQKGLPIFASRDWHRSTTRHFKTSGGPWPVHCVQNTPGAEFHSALKLPSNVVVLSKGIDPQKDGYSVFESEDNTHKSFINVLRKFDVGTIFVGGLAVEFCVQATVLDALKNGFRVYILIDAIKGIKEEAVQKAMKIMVKAGAKQITTMELIQKKGQDV